MWLSIRLTGLRLLSSRKITENITKRLCQSLASPDFVAPKSVPVDIATIKDDSSDLQEHLDNFLKQVFQEKENKSYIEPGGGGVEDEVAPFLSPTFNLAAYVSKSETLQKFIQLGVDLNKIERRRGLGQYFIKLDFERDCKDHLIFLNDIGVPADQFGQFITKNPVIFQEDLENLQVRVNYLASKNFEPEMISRVVLANPFWLMFSTKRIDRRLGYFQKNFKLSGEEVRLVTCRQPRLITYKLPTVEKNTFSIREEFGFEDYEIKKLLLTIPRIWMMNYNELKNRLNYIHNTMELPHEAIVRSPEIIYTRQFRLRQRHGFLVLLGRNQYDPTKELYVPLKELATATDKEFVENIAKSCMEEWDKFLRSQ